MKSENGANYGFEKDVDVDESVYCASAEIQAVTYDQYIGAELQLPDKDGIKQMARVFQILRNADFNPECNGKYRV